MSDSGRQMFDCPHGRNRDWCMPCLQDKAQALERRAGAAEAGAAAMREALRAVRAHRAIEDLMYRNVHPGGQSLLAKVDAALATNPHDQATVPLRDHLIGLSNGGRCVCCGESGERIRSHPDMACRRSAALADPAGAAILAERDRLRERVAELEERNRRLKEACDIFEMNSAGAAELAEALRPFAEYEDDGAIADCCPMRLWFEGPPGKRPTLGDCRHAKNLLRRGEADRAE